MAKTIGKSKLRLNSKRLMPIDFYLMDDRNIRKTINEIYLKKKYTQELAMLLDNRHKFQEKCIIIEKDLKQFRASDKDGIAYSDAWSHHLLPQINELCESVDFLDKSFAGYLYHYFAYGWK